MQHTIRRATPADLPALADLWHQGWAEAHAKHVPKALHDLRTRDSLLARLKSMPDVFLKGTPNAPQGFVALKGNEIYQFFVSPAARGQGLATELMAFGENHIANKGHLTAHLDVIPQNLRAIRFYEKTGWIRKGIQIIQLDTLDTPFPLPCLKMTKQLA